MRHVVPPGMVLCALAVTLSAQARDAYQQAYREWQQSDAKLERDAATAGEAVTPRTDKAAAAASKFVALRRAFYEAQRAGLPEELKALDRQVELPVQAEDAKAAGTYLSAQETALANSMGIFVGDPDRGIQQLRQALEKEHAALAPLRSAIEARQMAAGAAKEANDGANRARNDVLDAIKEIAASFGESAQNAGELAEAWPTYYRALASGARGVWMVGPANSTSTTISSESLRLVGGLPVSRYTGAWSFVFGTSTYRGVSPFSYDLFVREEGGRLFGTVNARFIVTNNADPAVKFSFSGPPQAERRQAFPLKTAEGVMGTIELIPGDALNMLEVNYSLDGAPGKVGQSGVILVKHSATAEQAP